MDEYLLTVFRYAHKASAITSYTTTKLIAASGPLRSILQNASSSNPDLTNIALLLVVIYLSLSILGMATRWMYNIVRNLIRLAMFAAVVVMVVWVYNAGFGEVVGTLEGVGGRLMDESRKGMEEGYVKGTEEGGGWPQGRSYA